MSKIRHGYPEGTRQLAIEMYYGGASGGGVGNILKMDRSNVMDRIKRDAFTVEGVNADLRHHTLALARRSRCFPRELEDLRAVFAVFVQAYDRSGLQEAYHRSCHPGAVVPFPLFDVL